MRLTVERLGHLGDGLTADGTRVPLSLPGETVSGEITDGRIADARILTPSPDRVRAPCAHFRACGGCSLQHASDAFLADWKTQVIETALSAQGLTAPLRPIHVSPPHTRRRATLAGRRTKKGALVGFHARRSDTIVASCWKIPPSSVMVRSTFCSASDLALRYWSCPCTSS